MCDQHTVPAPYLNSSKLKSKLSAETISSEMRPSTLFLVSHSRKCLETGSWMILGGEKPPSYLRWRDWLHCMPLQMHLQCHNVCMVAYWSCSSANTIRSSSSRRLSWQSLLILDMFRCSNGFGCDVICRTTLWSCMSGIRLKNWTMISLFPWRDQLKSHRIP